MKTYCRRMDISGENFIRKYIAAFIYDKLENGNMPSIFAYYGSISKNEARRRLENSPEFVASVIDQIAYEMSWHLKTRTVREHIYMVVPEEKLVKNVDIVDGMSGKIRTLGLEKMIMQLYEVLAKEAADELWTAKVGLFKLHQYLEEDKLTVKNTSNDGCRVIQKELNIAFSQTLKNAIPLCHMIKY